MWLRVCLLFALIVLISSELLQVTNPVDIPETTTEATVKDTVVVKEEVFEPTELNEENIQGIVDKYEFILILFYVRWCRFSVALLPTFDQLTQNLTITEHQKGNYDQTKFIITKIDCDIQEKLCEGYGILKYPTIKIIRHGSLEKLEYRRERTVEALVKYVNEELEDPTIEIKTLYDIDDQDVNMRKIIGVIPKDKVDIIRTFRKAATHFKTLCLFLLQIVDPSEKENNEVKIWFQPDEKSPEYEHSEFQYNESFSFQVLRDWANFKCVPFVREITFENAEELTEEGTPLFIFFYKPNVHTELIKKFKLMVASHFVPDILAKKINFVTADGLLFIHPLAHLNKSPNDLPCIAIDSLAHLFNYPYSKEEDLIDPEKIRKYLLDFYSEKLHIRYHGFIIDEDEKNESLISEISQDKHYNPNEPKDFTVQAGVEETLGTPRPSTIVQESEFVKLYPSDKRYTLKKKPIVKDEL